MKPGQLCDAMKLRSQSNLVQLTRRLTCRAARPASPAASSSAQAHRTPQLYARTPTASA